MLRHRARKVDGVSLNQFMAAAVAEKVGPLRTAAEFLKNRAGTAKPKDMIKYLRRAPGVAPMHNAPKYHSTEFGSGGETLPGPRRGAH